MPPRHGKSVLCSQYFPAWYLGTYPNRKVILCSYEAGFAADWGGKARDVLAEYGSLFGVGVREDRSARDDWGLDRYEGGMVTAGVGGAITGRGANLLTIDDPIKNSEEANSPIYREKVWQWWLSTASTRIEPNGSALIILTRWHEDDLAGRLLSQQDGDDVADDERWEVLNLPAIAEDNDDLGRVPGEALWPERWPLAKMLAIAKRVGSIVWTSLFQQRPTAPEGQYFKRAWFKEIIEPERVPRLVETVRCWDLAATVPGEKGNTDPDYLAGCKIGRDANGVYYILDMVHERMSAEEVEQTIKQTAAIDGRGVRIRIEQEGAASGKIVKYHFEKMLDGYDARFTGIPRASKYTRSGPFNAACERGDVKLVKHGGWLSRFIEEIVQFPNGKHDDQVDAAVGGYTALTSDAEPWDGEAFEEAFDGQGISLDDPEEREELSFEDRLMGRTRDREL